MGRQAADQPGQLRTLAVADITADGRCQPREAVNPRTVADYADDIASGAVFPPLTVYHDGERFWLADGFHRYAAAVQLGRPEVSCEVHHGTMRDAMLHAVGANATHGLRRTSADKRRAVEAMLTDAEWGRWSDREIARRCGVSHPFVAQVRASLETITSDAPRLYTDKYGNVAAMTTTNIGIRPAAPLDEAAWAPWREREPVPPELGMPPSERFAKVRRILPPLTRVEYAQLKASIARDGMIHPVLMDQDGVIIDGMHRVRAWTELRDEGVAVPDYPRRVHAYADDEERIGAWKSANLLRGSMARSQRAMATTDLPPEHWTEEERPVVERAAEIRHQAPEFAKLVEKGTLSL
ncbi:MAG: ParB N-terminal domain-containing protein, partial [Chloroflexota bacterium]|nr:ParB N-terminal domain-containing protein [Chloroflexota bacterium]